MLRERISNPDVERVLCGKLPEDRALTPLVPILSAFRDVTWPAPTDDAVAKFASAAATIARSATPVVPLKPALPGRSRFLAPAIHRGLATGLASVLLVSGLAGVAVASDDAAPGDFLYGIDRALESVGVGAGGATERLSEAWALFERGQMAEAVGHASRAVGVRDGENPTDHVSDQTARNADTLRSAARNVAGNSGGDALELRAAVAAMLNEMAAMLEDPALEGKDFGQSVAEMARLLGGNDGPLGPGKPEPDQPGPGNSDQASTPPSDNTPGPADKPPAAPADPPGKSDPAPGKSDAAPGNAKSSPGKSDKNQANLPTRP